MADTKPENRALTQAEEAGDRLSTAPSDVVSGTRKSRFGFMACMVVLLAFVLREQFVLTGIVDFPIQGDVNDYYAYAWNLVHYGTFSHALPGANIPLPDAYRSPGYPWLLTMCLWLWPQDPATSLGTWYPAMLQAQVLLGTASVLLAMLLARLCVSSAWAVVAGLLLALWPHHIAATGVLLSEVAFGFTLLAGLYCTSLAWKSNRKRWWIAGGIAFGYAYFINPLILFFPLLLAMAAWRKHHKKGASILLFVFLLPVALLAWRNAGIAPVPNPPIGRAQVNFVQGSWPNYHAARLRFYDGDPVAIAITEEINREARLLQLHPDEGFKTILSRFDASPIGYLTWYAWGKPWLLWDWDIRVGFGGFYFQKVHHSSLDRSPLRQMFQGFKALNPLLTLLALFGSIALLARRSPERDATSKIVAGLILYLTLIHVVFQAEPRYANAYRGIEAVVVAIVMAWISAQILRAWPGAAAKADPTKSDAMRHLRK